MPRFDLLRKTELKIDGIVLKKANLTEIAACAAAVLGLPPGEVVVVDYRNETLTLDILNSCVNAHNVVGKQDQLLRALGTLPGVSVGETTAVHSDGMLGWIAMDEEAATRALRQAERMAAEMARNLAKRAIVFSTGREVAEGEIEDTNAPAIMRSLAEAGYKVAQGPTLKDDAVLIAGKLREAIDEQGYGLVITTGGVGAEDKDFTVEAVKAVDPEAATPYICHFEIGTGRHVKDGIRIAVGEYDEALIVALPGPNDEVRASLGVLTTGLSDKQDKHTLAENIAVNLRGILRAKMSHHHH